VLCFPSRAAFAVSRRTLVASLTAFTLAQLAATAAYAAVPVKTIKAWRDNAPEMLEVTVLSIRKNVETILDNTMQSGGSVTRGDITLVAKIDAVHRTRSDLTVGDEIVIKYRFQRYEPIAPPDGNYGVLLNAEEKATVYLKQVTAKTYELACPVRCLVKR
jgi:hypothetical protein